ncbi:MAG: hypothetical protein QMD20_04905 [Candidatus Bathyarchaeia archaeon]|nr:hypothetical protein [Candidatus Bathyarchaeia archaeon]
MNVGKPSRELSVSEIFSLTFNLYLSNFSQFFLPFLISGIITGISTYVIMSSFPLPTPPSAYASQLISWFFNFVSTLITIMVLLGLVTWIVGTITASIVIKCASDQIEKGASSISTSFNFVISKLPSLLIAQLVSGILTAIGLFLFLVPGIIIAIMFSLVLPVIVVEQKGAFESLGRSKKLVSNRWLKTFALMLIVGIIVIIVNLITKAVATPFIVIHPIVNTLVTNIISALISPISPIAITYLYYAMVAREIPPPPPPPF